ncbi:MAG: hypothetical protein ABI469_11480 [Gemmatimonadales bacterium]
MQTPAPQAPSANAPVIAGQAPSPLPAGVVVVNGPPGTPTFTIAAPRTARDLEALKARRSELSDQLTSVDGRRSKLLSQLKTTGDPIAIKGLEGRLALLDARQLQLESDIQQTGQQLTSASAGQIATTSLPAMFGGFTSKQVFTLSILSIIFVLGPLAVGIGRSFIRRSNKPALPPAVFAETAQRLERLEASVDAVAIEVERISEGQRFVTKLLSEGQGVPLVAGQKAGETVRVDR